MSRAVLVAGFGAWLTVSDGRVDAVQPDGGCGRDPTAAMQAATAHAQAGDFEDAARTVRDAYALDTTCAPLVVAAWAWHGWMAAATAAGLGGAPEALGGVRAALEILEAPDGGPSSSRAYAAAIVHAARAAAQSERDEMRVWLEHAGSLARRLLVDERPWPLPYPIAEGELWLAVSDFELAEAAFARALADGDSAVALRGVAWARQRRAVAGSCAPFRRALELVAGRPSGAIMREADAFLRSCR
jgi:tetratricopeptide (TPR) repeat protein